MKVVLKSLAFFYGWPNRKKIGLRGARPLTLLKMGIDDLMARGALITVLMMATIVSTVPAVAFDIRPDPDSTEGSVRIDGHQIAMTCGHAKEHRGGMTADRRDEVFLRYGLPVGQNANYQIDHLIPLCLGGSDDFSNLWPQPRQSIEPKWNAEAKDRLEQLICQMVCNNQLDLATAQEAFIHDWIAAYRKYYGDK